MDFLIAGVGAEVGLVVVDEEVLLVDDEVLIVDKEVLVVDDEVLVVDEEVLVKSVVRVVTVERVELSVAGTEEEDEDAAARIEVLLEEASKLELLAAATLKTETELPPVADLM